MGSKGKSIVLGIVITLLVIGIGALTAMLFKTSSDSKNEILGYKEQIQLLQKDIESYQEKLSNAENNLETAAKEKRENENKINQYVKENAQLLSKNSKYEKQIADLNSKIKTANITKDKIKEYENEIKKLNSEIEENNKTIESNNTKITELETAIAESTNKINDLEIALGFIKDVTEGDIVERLEKDSKIELYYDTLLLSTPTLTDKDIILDLNGYNLELALLELNNTKLKIIDSSLRQTGSITLVTSLELGGIQVNEGSTLIVDSGLIYGENVITVNEGGIININGGFFSSTDVNSLASHNGQIIKINKGAEGFVYGGYFGYITSEKKGYGGIQNIGTLTIDMAYETNGELTEDLIYNGTFNGKPLVCNLDTNTNEHGIIIVKNISYEGTAYIINTEGQVDLSNIFFPGLKSNALVISGYEDTEGNALKVNKDKVILSDGVTLEEYDEYYEEKSVQGYLVKVNN